jgi:hypothetical protein
MAMNKRGQAVMVGFMLAVMAVFVIMAFVPSINTQVETTRTSLSCGAAGLSLGTQGMCVLLDTITWYVSGIFLGSAVQYFVARQL